jgi:hypothetical protein
MLSKATALALYLLALGSSQAKRRAPVEYYAVTGYDSAGGKLHRLYNTHVSEVKKWCDKLPACLGYTTQGMLKKSFKPRSQWKSNEKTFVTYVKVTSAIPPDSFDGRFERYIGYNIKGHNIKHVKGSTDDAKEHCQVIESCTAANSLGWLKRSNISQKDWVYDATSETDLFIKGHYTDRRA